MNKMIKRRKDDGFTLIELMIVIAVIGILAVVLVPKMGNVKTSAKLAGVQTNYRSVAATLQGGHFTDNASVQTYLNGIYTGTNVLTNPITKTTNISLAAATAGAVISDSAAAVPAVATSVPAYQGAVVVIPNLTLTTGTGSITVYACDDKGQLMSSDMVNVMQF